MGGSRKASGEAKGKKKTAAAAATTPYESLEGLREPVWEPPARDYSAMSVWFATLPEPPKPRRSFAGRVNIDVAIIGAGYTGLWTAYYLKKAAPQLSIVVLEKEVAGFGGSGRNGGWCHPYLPVSYETLARESSRELAVATQEAMYATIDEVGRVAAEEGIDAGYHKGGMLSVATAPEQLERVHDDADYLVSWGFGDRVTWLRPDEADEHLKVHGCLGAAYTSQSAVVHPAKLVRGLADVVERLGVPVFENSPVLHFEPGTIHLLGGMVNARFIVRATEGFTTSFRGHSRDYIPIYSLMVATPPLPDSFWDEVGWQGRETLGDGRHVYIYAARTPDDRIAIGGRGAPYHLGSRVDARFEHVPAVFEKLRGVLRTFFPAVGNVQVTHTWGGPLAIPRDWHPAMGLDRATGLAWAGGYVGDGVSTSNLSGRVLTDLILGRQTELTALPLVNHRSRQWEPEPLRWVGVRGSLAVMTSADRKEERTGRPARRATVMKKILGL